MAEDNILPWKPDTRQVQGRKTEKQLILKLGGVVHPSSGSGRIKDDGHDDQRLFEIKDAGRTHRIDVKDLIALYHRAIRQNRTPTYMIRFAGGIILEGTIRPEEGTWGK
jgi:hypothetical protein